jgi:hypothetical protein
MRKHRIRNRPKSKTLCRPLRPDEKEAKAQLDSEGYVSNRPLTRGECIDGPRPCPWVSCQYHLYLDVTDKGSLKLNFPDLEVWELPATCALDMAELGPMTLEETGYYMNMTRERIRQIETIALDRCGDVPNCRILSTMLDRK